MKVKTLLESNGQKCSNARRSSLTSAATHMTLGLILTYVLLSPMAQTACATDVYDVVLIGDLTGHSDSVTTVAWSPNGTLVASGSRDCTIRVWNGIDGELIKVLRDSVDDFPVNSLSWSPNGLLLTSGLDNNTITVWDYLENSPSLGINWGYDDSIKTKSIQWSPDGTKLAVGGNGPMLIVLDDMGHGPIVFAPTLQSDPVLSVAWSPSGNHIASSSWHPDGGGFTPPFVVRVWSTDTESLFANLLHMAWSVAWSPDGTKIASAGADFMIKIWDVYNGTLFKTLTGHGGEVKSVAWSPDGSRLVSGGKDKKVIVWDLASGDYVKILEGHLDQVNSVGWSSDGMRISSGSDDGTVRIWEVKKGETTTRADSYAFLYISMLIVGCFIGMTVVCVIIAKKEKETVRSCLKKYKWYFVFFMSAIPLGLIIYYAVIDPLIERVVFLVAAVAALIIGGLALLRERK